MCAQALNLWVFREDRRRIPGQQLKSVLRCDIEQCRAFSGDEDRLLAALLRAGEFECALADLDASSVTNCAALTDSLARALVSPTGDICVDKLLGEATRLIVPELLEVSPPEGFAYYALHPLAYADVLQQILSLRESVAIVGIRSIGTTLSAVATAAACERGIKAERITVRPEGHPYNRRTRFSPSQREFIQRHSERGSTFLVVDEGPGLSGSSFISLAEAIEQTGVPADRITLVCSHLPRFNELCADEAARRATRFRWQAVDGEPRRPAAAKLFIGGGEWRTGLFATQDRWPASWTSLERLKYLSAEGKDDQRRLFKFVGLGHYGRPAFDRENLAAAAGFGPAPHQESNGFVSYPWIAGRPMSAEDLSARVLERLAAYLAFRVGEFPIDSPDSLQEMAEHNLAQLQVELPFRLRVERPVVCDSRMQPHEWLLTSSGEILKTDSGAHGDDHFFPGPTDIAWDLAGAIVEWKMAPAQTRFFLETYAKASGDAVNDRITDYIIAYAGFRWAYCRMAANALHASEERSRLEEASGQYENFLLQRAHQSFAHV